MGAVVLGVMMLYLLISFLVVKWAILYARKNGMSTKRWGWGAVLIMYLIPFWDWLPSVIIHQSYCATESGYWEYKSLDQWRKENLDVIESLDANPPEQFRISPFPGNKKYYLLSDNTSLVAYYDKKDELMFVNFDKPDGSKGYWLNQRFNLVIKEESFFPLNYMIRREHQVVDSKTNQVMVRYIDFSTSQIRGGAGWSGWKFWLHSPHCRDGNVNKGKFYDFERAVKRINQSQ